MTTVDGNSLAGVSATALWTLRNRVTEAGRSDGLIEDPWAVKLFGAIGYDYDKSGRINQFHPLRALTFDAATSEYLQGHPRASVVALAEGLQTSFWRLDSAGLAREVTWYSVDLQPVMALRRQLLPHPTTASSNSPNRRWTAAGWTGSTPATASSSPPKAC